MKISIDGGALNQKADQRFGTAVFSENIVKALSRFDKSNHYIIYTLNKLKPRLAWSRIRLSIEEFIEKKDIFLALNQAVPLYTSGKIISFCHGLSYRFYPELYSNKDVIRLNKQLKEMVKRSDKIIVSSEKIKKEITSLYRYIERKVFVLPFGIPLDMINKPTFVKIAKGKYFLFVANNQKIKNADFVINGFNMSKLYDQGYKLYLVGNWKDHENIDQGIISLDNVSRKKLSTLYQRATALLSTSYYESFNFPVLEALSQGCPVIGLKSAIIPELKPYVNVCKNQNEFVKNMKAIKLKPNKISINKIKMIFNWKKYVKNLVRLY